MNLKIYHYIFAKFISRSELRTKKVTLMSLVRLLPFLAFPQFTSAQGILRYKLGLKLENVAL